MFLLYNPLSSVALFVYLPWLLFKKGPEDRLRYLKERLGLSRYANTDIWIHAVSVGEVIAALPLLRLLKKELPQIKIVLSTTTYTGQRVAQEKFPEAERIMYMPWDSGLCVERAVKLSRPKIFITIETELWPLLFKRLKEIGSCIVVLNGRISMKSFKGYRRIKPFMKGVLSNVDFLYMQGNDDAQRIISLGADLGKVVVMGNLKFDLNIPEFINPLPWINTINGDIFVAGSTHKGEEDIVLSAFESVKKTIPNLKLILAPRHPERFQEVEELLRKRGLNFIRRSMFSPQSSVLSPQSKDCRLPVYDIILLDTIGELSGVFSIATIAFVGGSLLPYGGHNILEPAYWSKPIIFGPHMDNFPIAKEFLRQDAALIVKDSEDMAKTIENLLKHPEKASEIGKKAKMITEGNTGAVGKALELIKGILLKTKGVEESYLGTAW